MLSDFRFVRKPVSALRVELQSVIEWKDHALHRKVYRDMVTFGKELAKSRVMRLSEDNPERIDTLHALCARGWHHATYHQLMEVFLPNVMQFSRDAAYKRDIGEWTAVPWAGEAWFYSSPYQLLHGLHMSEKTPGNVAFAETLAKWQQDRFTSVKPGRYLTKFFGNVLSENEIRRWAERCAASVLPAELCFIESNDPDGWVRVYRDGPSSCMQGEDCVRIYAHSKSVLRLAYLQQGEGIVGRAIVRDDRKQYIRIYPNTDCRENQQLHDRLRTMLEDLGYVEGTLDGVLLVAEETGYESGEYVMPYLDHGAGGRPRVTLTSDGCYFRVGKNGDYEADSTSGAIQLEQRVRCDECGEMYDPDDVSYVEGHGDICNDCLEESFVLARARYGHEYLRIEDAIYCETDGEYYTEEGAAKHDIHECEESGKHYSLDDLACTSRGWIYIHHVCIVSLDEPDSDGNEYAHRDDTVHTHDGRVIHTDCSETRTLTRVYHVNDPVDETETETAGE